MIHSWPLCCGARQFLSDGPDTKEREWEEDYLDEDEYGFLASNQPLKGLAELIPGFWYFCGEEWDEEFPDESEKAPPSSMYQNPFVYEILRNSKFRLIANFSHGCKFPDKIKANIDPSMHTFAILSEEQHNFHQRALLDLDFKVAKRFLNPYHDGTKCTLYMREPKDLPNAS